ncbi:C-3 sterol dehydrogenase/C-4 decarboxylase family protein [Pyrenophora tritici-repentis]|nr:C-3 sterol dehydrogenase/C-4 decarboxylase family protein [Pyrenophora tritici-repentis]KAI0612447.1 C-3 sterol dehydrogenase/C-4 decarboxylase family protein [Pyrenophora tritici-repentis]KAI1563794.1 hydroxysteroid dehydrogenase [Pyrenophora tritici-repentis]KAI1567463.1 hydroxysteroid dehydrogenase [Pyrenophora tritici-repentis]KAI1583117.1 hydroxysteroid dehydrogenase [Pyrenophora tritici-repentis]
METTTFPEHSPLHRSTILITGGNGGLASQMLKLFSQRGCSHLHSVDLQLPLHRLEEITYHVGDLTDSTAMRRIFQTTKPDIVINVDGTKSLVQIAKDSGTSSFVYTSSASVVSDAATDLRYVDETLPMILEEQQRAEFYTYTKALAETYVLSQNQRAQDSSSSSGGTSHFLTCAIRPSGIFGFGDLTVLPGILNAYYR